MSWYTVSIDCVIILDIEVIVRERYYYRIATRLAINTPPDSPSNTYRLTLADVLVVDRRESLDISGSYHNTCYGSVIANEVSRLSSVHFRPNTDYVILYACSIRSKKICSTITNGIRLI